jgi:hypothetical protein
MNIGRFVFVDDAENATGIVIVAATGRAADSSSNE